MSEARFIFQQVSWHMQPVNVHVLFAILYFISNLTEGWENLSNEDELTIGDSNWCG